MNIENPSITQTYTDIPVTFVNESYIESMNNIALMVDGKDSVNVRIRAVSDTIKKLNKENITAVADRPESLIWILMELWCRLRLRVRESMMRI